MNQKRIAIIGGGPAGLAAAELLSRSGHTVTVYDAMPTFARKFLLAGKSGLNITHSEDYARFTTRFGAASARLRPALDAFTPDDIRDWAAGLGTETFVGSSGRVFPKVMKASPLLRAWLKRLEAQGTAVRTRHRWTGFAEDGYVFETPEGRSIVHCDAALLALGGASWPRLGSDASWLPWLSERGVEIDAFRPANCGFVVGWSGSFSERFAGEPVKSVTATSEAGTFSGEFVITESGIEGSLIYAHTASLRDRLLNHGSAALTFDLAPGRTIDRLSRDLARQDAKSSFSNRLRKGAGLDGVKAALLRELAPERDRTDAERLAGMIKALPVPVIKTRPIGEAISSAGGIRWSSINDSYMLKALPGTFVAGEMLDWEAPTGGYLLTACLATGRAAARGIEAWLQR
ncbi:TIGR03862 family flavoprotein [Rhizobium leguminosarum]|uniref:TIGR03862 family flavoprotein n=1 Tax=Rhizobium leguminosarum TaxID=384 RepID=UPI0014419552|nr:TIGR03862 family flavoprotein [Rhizobium leguminosarum]NKK68537.1 TIGR03862 family flavoprotein [Rhizobium leguminosarum bv. viciae]NKL10134.1 TIGR03862 family flavoprotein [Rhizobium leguminosarum bv. viciae]NKL86935.1 TIGR03862 family flavoprotein [Rhizobium leguminosarum bv. viciae]NKL95307.1 TIGR03862 family flavoprotein [Rhizobium leguminosarum bv. viciae]NKM96246.1 TIGR03862 family flavoprotein [Rhizobium leguminosarum bv. viciae]